MKVSHEVPRCLLTASSEFNDYDYCLPHLLDKHADYRQFFLDSRERDRFIIMDNGLFEGVTHTIEDLREKIKLIEPDIFIVPDEWNNKTITAKNAKHWMQYELPERTNLMVVMQGTTISEIHQLYHHCVDLGYTHFAFNHSSVVYHVLCPTENLIANQAVGRVLLLENMKHENLIKPHHYIHLLGCSVPQEFGWYDGHPQIESIDTSNPIMAALEGTLIWENGLNKKPKANMNDHFDTKFEDIQYEDILHNTTQFRIINNLKPKQL